MRAANAFYFCRVNKKSMRKNFTLLLLIPVSILFFACAKTDLHAPASPVNLPGNATAYVAGSANDTAVYFVNGKEYVLTSGKTPAAANSLVISGAAIYIAGYESNGAHTAAKYWKNGIATVLSDTSLNAAATSIAVSGSDIYVAGWITLGTNKAAALWHNGSLTQLTASGHSGAANALFFSGGDVYVAGYDSTATRVSACYWKNGAITTLPDSLSYAVAQGITVGGSDVYVAGWGLSPDGFSYLAPRLWKNGSALPLATTSNSALATSVAVSGNTTYVTGRDDYRAVYWENGTEKLNGDGFQSNAIAIDDNVLYFAGTAGGANVANAVGTSPVFWRNDIAFPLGYGPGTANAIVVTN